MAVMGLADGFLAGFNTMNTYQRGQKADDRAEKALSLRDAIWQNNLDRQRQSDERYADETAYARQRDSKQDEREALRDGLYEEQVRSSIASTRAANARAARADSRAEEEYQWLKDRREKEAYQQEHLPLIQQGWQSIAEGNVPSDAFWKVVRDPRAGQYNPERYMDSQYAAAGKHFVAYAGGLMREAEGGELDWNGEEGVKRINSPDFLKAAGTLYQDEIKTGIGDIDPKTGKSIKDKELGSIMVTPDGAGVVLGVKVTYDDGSTALRPVTENRTSRNDDQPRVIPISDFIGAGYKRAALSREMVANADTIRTSLGLTPEQDVKGYRQAVVKVQADAEKAISQVRRDSMLSQEEKESAIAAEREAAQQQVLGLRDVYGLKVSQLMRQEQPTSDRSSLSQWAGGDPERLQFIKEANQHGKLNSLLENNAQVDAVFTLWRQQLRAVQQASVTAEAVRQQAPGPAPHNYRAPEEAAFNAFIQPFVNGVPQGHRTDDGTTAYKAITNR